MLIPLLYPLLAACTADPPSASRISPTTGPAGTAVTVSGTGFSESMSVKLGRKPLSDLAVIDETTLTGTVPDGLSPGPANLIISVPQPIDPCSSEIKRMTHIPADGSSVKIDRHLPGGEVDRIQIAVRDLKAVEYGETQTGEDGICRTVYLRTRDDQRYLFDASSTEDLRWQAQRIAGGLGKPLEVGETLSEVTREPEDGG